MTPLWRQVMPQEADCATVWVLAGGQILSADSQFQDWFGHSANDVEGGSVASLTPSAKQLEA